MSYSRTKSKMTCSSSELAATHMRSRRSSAALLEGGITVAIDNNRIDTNLTFRYKENPKVYGIDTMKAIARFEINRQTNVHVPYIVYCVHYVMRWSSVLVVVQ